MNLWNDSFIKISQFILHFFLFFKIKRNDLDLKYPMLIYIKLFIKIKTIGMISSY